MMNLKKYRATTTRDALEMIKQDLGEDAFVVETKHVRSRGFLGLRSSMQVEISAAASPVAAERPITIKDPKSTFSSHRILNLKEDSIALPKAISPVNSGHDGIMSALNARANSSYNFERDVAPGMAQGEVQKFESVEVSPLAPRIVHPKKENVKPIQSTEKVDEKPIAEMTQPTQPIPSNRDLELLRAEMREVKFSLDAFTNRQQAHSANDDFELEAFCAIADPPFHEVYLELTGRGVPGEMASKFVGNIIEPYKDNSVSPDRLVNETLRRGITSTLKFQADVLQQDKPAIMAVIGATGVGKTTTIAKLAARVALYEHRRVELVTLDTYRIAAVEQLKTYAEIIGAGCHVVRSVFELDAVIRRLPPDATILIDTTGRSPLDLADQYELTDYLRGRDEIHKCLVVQATTHPVDASAAIKKFGMYGADCLAVTKMDETMRPGAVIEAIAENDLPLAYFCTGQRVPEDLQVATAEAFSNRIVSPRI